jgi:hypothetical protein
LKRLASVQVRSKGKSHAAGALIAGAPHRMRLVLREDGSVGPIVEGGAMDQPAWLVEAVACYHGALSGERSRKMEAERKRARR